MGNMKFSSDGMGDTVTDSKTCRIKCHSCQTGGVVYLFPRRQIRSVFVCLRKEAEQERRRFFRQRVRKVCRLRGHIGFQRVGCLLYTSFAAAMTSQRAHRTLEIGAKIIGYQIVRTFSDEKILAQMMQDFKNEK